MRTHRLLLAVLAITLIAPGCGDDDETAAPRTSDTSALVDQTVEVLAIDNAFEPAELEIEAGTTVVWRNTGRNDHNVVAEDDAAAWNVATENFLPGDEAEFRFTEPGTYRYYCSIHGTIDVGMTGEIVVTQPGDS